MILMYYVSFWRMNENVKNDYFKAYYTYYISMNE